MNEEKKGAGDNETLGPSKSLAGGGQERAVSWGPRYSVLGIGLTFVFLALAIFPLSLLGLDLGHWSSVAYAQLATGLAFIFIPYFLIRLRGGSWKDLGFRSFSPMIALRWTSLALIVYLLFVMLYGLLFPTTQENIQDSFGPLALQIFFIVFLAPISEEICFRGFLFQGLLKRFSFLPAAFFSSLLFGFLHLSSGPGAIPVITLLGMLFALLYYKSNSLWPAIILHALNNAVVLIALTL